MKRRQTIQWLIVKDRLDRAAFRRLPRFSGVLLLERPSPAGIRYLRYLAKLRSLEVVVERPRTAARVHNMDELRRALQRRVPLILLSPLAQTGSHPDWKPIPRMRAAALTRLGRRKLLALGGMNQRRFTNVARLGFVGWAGIGAWLEFTKLTR
jgi:thiamine monophosphate synthase